eukprot:COSAG02_NODE_2281_length_9231_cov_15.017959_4_plen_64_part_00
MQRPQRTAGLPLVSYADCYWNWGCAADRCEWKRLLLRRPHPAISDECATISYLIQHYIGSLYL